MQIAAAIVLIAVVLFVLVAAIDGLSRRFSKERETTESRSPASAAVQVGMAAAILVATVTEWRFAIPLTALAALLAIAHAVVQCIRQRRQAEHRR